MKWAEDFWAKQTGREDEIREIQKLEQIIGYSEDGIPVTRGQYEGGQYNGPLYEGAVDRIDPGGQGEMTAAMKNYEFLVANDTPQEDAAQMAFNGGLSDPGYDNTDIEKSLKITKEILGDEWEPGQQIPAGKLNVINKARANAGLEPLVESSERNAKWWLPEELEGERYAYSSMLKRPPLKQPPRTAQAGPSGSQLKTRKPLTTFPMGPHNKSVTSTALHPAMQ